MKYFALLCVVCLVPMVGWPADPTDEQRLAKWEKDTTAHAKRLTEKPPAPASIFFVGSSSIVRWNTAKAFPDWKTVNVGFGGSEIRDSTLYAEKLITKYEPKTIVFYAGDNDINNKRTPTQVRDDFQDFTKTIHAKCPHTTIIFVAIKPSVARWALFAKQKEANELVQKFCATDKRLQYFDVVTPMLSNDGPPANDWFVKDGLHLSEKGYELWEAELRKLLKNEPRRP